MRILNLATSTFLMTLAGTMFAVYFMGYWGDTNKLIEYSEVCFMFLLCVLGVVGVIFNCRRLLSGD